MNIFKKLLICSLFLSTVPVHAAQATHQQVAELLKVTRVDQLSQETVKALKPTFQQQADAIVQNYLQKQELTPKEQDIANELSEKLYQSAQKAINWTTLQPLLESVYLETFTAKEVQAQIDFYSSEEGQSILQKTPLIAKKTMELTNRQLMQSMQTAKEEYADINKKLEALKSK